MTEVTITAQPNRSYKVTGPVKVIDAKGNEKDFGEGEEVFLCWCGESKTKPFCDASHRTCGFRDE